MPIPGLLAALAAIGTGTATAATTAAGAGAAGAGAAGLGAAGGAAGLGALPGVGTFSPSALAGLGISDVGMVPGAALPATGPGGGFMAGLGKFGKSMIPSLLSSTSMSFGGRDFGMTLGDPRTRMIQQMMDNMGGGMNPSVITRTGQKEDPFSMLGRLIAPRFRFNMGR